MQTKSFFLSVEKCGFSYCSSFLLAVNQRHFSQRTREMGHPRPPGRRRY
jgi:hypothetical protein